MVVVCKRRAEVVVPPLTVFVSCVSTSSGYYFDSM